MKKILITVYAVNPFKGSEDGTGWNITRRILQQFNVILVTRKNNIEHLKKYIEENECEDLKRITYVGFDLPYWVLNIKRQRGSKAHGFYFYLWQRKVIRFIKEFKFPTSLIQAA